MGRSNLACSIDKKEHRQTNISHQQYTISHPHDHNRAPIPHLLCLVFFPLRAVAHVQRNTTPLATYEDIGCSQKQQMQPFNRLNLVYSTHLIKLFVKLFDPFPYLDQGASYHGHPCPPCCNRARCSSSQGFTSPAASLALAWLHNQRVIAEVVRHHHRGCGEVVQAGGKPSLPP